MADERGKLILLADISGYTTFVGGTVLDHGRMWTARLLELVAERLATRLGLSAVEGDALAFYGGGDADHTLLPLLVETYREFRRVAATIDPCTGCACAACDSGKDMELKYIAHAGPFVEQIVAGRHQLYGPDVNLAFRLLKNHIPAHHYVFVTDAAAGLLPLGADAIPHLETVGTSDVRGHYRILA